MAVKELVSAKHIAETCLTTVESGLCRSTESSSCLYRPAAMFIFFMSNVVVIPLAVMALRTSCLSSGRERAVPPLCVPCQDVVEFGEGWKWKVEGRSREEDGSLCCPRHHHQVHQVLTMLFDSVYSTQKQNAFQMSDYVDSEHQKITADFIKPMGFDNQHKPIGHVTAVQKYEPQDANVLSNGSDVEVLYDWPLQEETDRTTRNGYVRQLSWGLEVPSSGLYHLHSLLNFFFTSAPSHQGVVQAVHQILRYRARDRTITVLAQRSQSVSPDHMDGLTSFVWTLANLDIGDVISVGVSPEVSENLQDRWRTEGLFLVQ